MRQSFVKTICRVLSLPVMISDLIDDQQTNRNNGYRICEDKRRTVFIKAVDQPHGHANKKHKQHGKRQA